MLRERDHPAPPAPLDVDWMLFAACSELEVVESDRLFFCGQGQSRLADQARAICAGCEVQGECLEFALRTPTRPSSGCGAGPLQASVGDCADCLDESILGWRSERISMTVSLRNDLRKPRSAWRSARDRYHGDALPSELRGPDLLFSLYVLCSTLFQHLLVYV
jgi:hypothetical protein